MTINNIDDLRDEIARLKAQKNVQEAAIKEHFASPKAIFQTLLAPFKGSDIKESLFNHEDILSLVSRFFLPFALNKTFFRKSNFLIKALVGLVSQKASGFITQDNVTSIWDKIKSFIPSRKANKKPVDYGIPPYSESY
jgi:hypothetical protein